MVNFWPYLLGHLMADYLLQPEKMARQKGRRGWAGTSWCLLHCLIYTICVCGMTGNWSVALVTLVYLSHYLPDRYSLATYWLRLIHGRDILQAHGNQTDDYREISVSFACLVYAVTDNTLHLLALWFIARYFG